LRIILAGFGVVGQSLAKQLLEHEQYLKHRFGVRPRIVGVTDSGGSAINEAGLNLRELLNLKASGKSVCAHAESGRRGLSLQALLDEVDADVMVECTPSNFESGEPGYQNILAAFKHKLHVVTVNKGPLALALPMLLELAQFNGVQFKFGGSVGGGTPILNFVTKCLRGDKIESVRGVLNGTCNYVLTRMEEDGISLNEAVSQAQREGLAEADPSLDLKGIDAAAKLVILSNLALGTRAVLNDVSRTGIDGITLDQLERAKRRGKLIRLIASADGGLKVAPEEVDRNHPLAVKGSINVVTFKSSTAGEETVMGKGAGGVETASAVIRDLIDIKDRLLAHSSPI